MIDIEVCKRVRCGLITSSPQIAAASIWPWSWVVLGGGPSRGRVGTAVETSEDTETRPQLSGTSQPSLTSASVSIRVDRHRLSSCLYFDLKRDVKNRLSAIDNHFQ